MCGCGIGPRITERTEQRPCPCHRVENVEQIARGTRQSVEAGNDQGIPCPQHFESLRQLLAIALYAARGFMEHLRGPVGNKCRALCIEGLAVC